jgi:hypothetical protein
MACCLRNLVAKISKQNTSDPTGQNKTKHMDYLTCCTIIVAVGFSVILTSQVVFLKNWNTTIMLPFK